METPLLWLSRSRCIVGWCGATEPQQTRVAANYGRRWLCGSLFGLFFLLVLPTVGFARRGAPPPSSRQETLPLSAIARLELPAVDVQALRSQDATAVESVPLRYATPWRVDITPETDGTWEQLPHGSRLWRLRVHAPGATDLSFGFTRYRLPAGATLHISSEVEDYYEGPYTAQDNKVHGQLWTPLVPGDSAVLELFLPADTPADLVLQLTRVGVGYRDLFQRQSVPKRHGKCNIDVACPEGDAWRDQIRSVARYSIEGSTLCTGTLIMDVPGSFRPFFLSAAHCEVTADNAPSIVVYWNYEAPQCGQPRAATLTQNQTGATFRAARAAVDMLLVELDDVPDPAFQVFYSGWDRSGAIPQGSVGIHHPSSHVKSISINDDPLRTSNTCFGNSDIDTHWRVNNWELGTTESGSSGSGLWDIQTKQLVGFLSNGTAACSNRSGFDCYGRFSVAWDNGPRAASRLQDWLDPHNEGVMTVNGANLPARFPVTIPDNSTVSIPLEIQDDVLLSDVNVLVHIRHTSVSDLELRLRSPAGTEVVLLNRPACTDNNMFITFDDDSTFDPQNHCVGTIPWYSGMAAPVEALAAFNGESSAGTWRLIVSDRAARHTGEVRDWQLLTSAPSVCNTCKIAVLEHNTTDGNVQVIVKDAVGKALLAALDFGAAHTPIAVAALPDLNGNGAPELAVLGRRARNGKVQVFIKDALTGDLVSTQDFSSSYLPVGLTILPDLDGNGVPELAVLGQHLHDGKIRVFIKDALTGAASPTLSFGSVLTPVALTTVEWPTPAQ